MEPLPGDTEGAAVMPDPPPRTSQCGRRLGQAPSRHPPRAMETARRQPSLTIATAGGGRAVGTTAQPAINGGWKRRRRRRVGRGDFDGGCGRLFGPKHQDGYCRPWSTDHGAPTHPCRRRRGAPKNGSRVGAAAAPLSRTIRGGVCRGARGRRVAVWLPHPTVEPVATDRVWMVHRVAVSSGNFPLILTLINTIKFLMILLAFQHIPNENCLASASFAQWVKVCRVAPAKEVGARRACLPRDGGHTPNGRARPRETLARPPRCTGDQPSPPATPPPPRVAPRPRRPPLPSSPPAVGRRFPRVGSSCPVGAPACIAAACVLRRVVGARAVPVGTAAVPAGTAVVPAGTAAVPVGTAAVPAQGHRNCPLWHRGRPRRDRRLYRLLPWRPLPLGRHRPFFVVDAPRRWRPPPRVFLSCVFFSAAAPR